MIKFIIKGIVNRISKKKKGQLSVLNLLIGKKKKKKKITSQISQWRYGAYSLRDPMAPLKAHWFLPSERVFSSVSPLNPAPHKSK